MALRARAPSGRGRAGRRPWLARWSRGEWLAALAGALLGGGLMYAYVAYARTGDVAPDSLYGYTFAIAGTILLALVGAGYTLRKRLWRGRFGLLHTALSWHIVGGVLGLALILAHAVGNFHPRTGSYALYSLIALVISGVIGKMLDHVMPRLAARAALQTLTADGEERLDALVGVLTSKRQIRRERRRTARWQDTTSSGATGGVTDGASGRGALRDASSAPWDLAYYDLSAPPDEISALLHQRQGRGERPAPRAASPLVSESSEIGQALGMERFYLSLIRVWRYLHAALSMLTLALILWHLEYAATLLLNTR